MSVHGWVRWASLGREATERRARRVVDVRCNCNHLLISSEIPYDRQVLSRPANHTYRTTPGPWTWMNASKSLVSCGEQIMSSERTPRRVATSWGAPSFVMVGRPSLSRACRFCSLLRWPSRATVLCAARFGWYDYTLALPLSQRNSATGSTPPVALHGSRTKHELRGSTLSICLGSARWVLEGGSPREIACVAAKQRHTGSKLAASAVTTRLFEQLSHEDEAAGAPAAIHTATAAPYLKLTRTSP